MLNPIKTESSTKNPRRMKAGGLNLRKRQGLTPEGKKRLQTAIQLHRPWEKAKGPCTPAGKLISSLNGRNTKRGYAGVRAMQRDLSAVRAMICQMQSTRVEIQKALTNVMLENTCENQ